MLNEGVTEDSRVDLEMLSQHTHQIVSHNIQQTLTGKVTFFIIWAHITIGKDELIC